ncbi:hypothetical protein BpHYR1_018091 [Brachionus plicatilis]|uniref:Uncharacterized protein n=1 Tax=Brachionus plicatilis TaxID=10195 RepID=A0A3M7SKX2_BRAPC|nr:hypothetical protein BpHYR1_018091 [Brachionus plicatilis]
MKNNQEYYDPFRFASFESNFTNMQLIDDYENSEIEKDILCNKIFGKKENQDDALISSKSEDEFTFKFNELIEELNYFEPKRKNDLMMGDWFAKYKAQKIFDLVFYYNQNIPETIHPGEKLGTFLESSFNFLQLKWGSVGGQLKNCVNYNEMKFAHFKFMSKKRKLKI